MPKIETIRHSLSHIMALAIQKLYPKTKFGIGPAIENGFYYDVSPRAIGTDTFATEELPLATEDLPKIEARIRELLKKGIVFEKKEISKKEVKKIFKDQPYKLELIDELEGKITIYKSGDFVDLCSGPHVKSTKEIPADGFKLTKVAGAYWRGNEKNKMLTRIYGIAFASQKELRSFLKLQEEAEKRDHRKIGQELELFIIDKEFGKGLPIWLPKGAILRQLIMDFALNTYLEQGHQLVATPHIALLDLWKRSGHWDFFRENMYPPMKVESKYFMLKPMNCPGHVKIYNAKMRSYKDLPLRFTEMGTVYRFERSGVLHGLTRVRGFTQDDAHIFCTPEQLPSELTKMIDLTEYILTSLGFKKFKVSLSVRGPEKKKYLGSDKIWNLAEKALGDALAKKELSFERYPGEAVFYGPKIDLLIPDAIGREWQLTTIQVDFNFPERFDLAYIDKKGRKKRPIMLHRALLGSLERFIGILLEHYAGSLPLWLSPIQVWVIPVGSSHRKHCQEAVKSLELAGFRTEARLEAETVSKKIRQGELQKIPYMLVIGDKEVKEKSVRVRKRQEGDLGTKRLDLFIKELKKEIQEKK